MTTRMLVDATHPEETRIAITRGNKLEDLDFEIKSRKQLKGNIYLARVVRVEPSLQAAFIEYGGNRHGFLPFAEIHPDYYRIPVSDREAILAAQKQEQEQAAAAEVLSAELLESPLPDVPATEALPHEDMAPLESFAAFPDVVVEEQPEISPQAEESLAHAAEEEATVKPIEVVGGEDVDTPRRHPRFSDYRIQEVIKRGQVVLVQVTKEERGNKGAALTTYLSLPGRYCVLMPNTPQGGGVSRKITDPEDRKRLKELMDALELPEGMSVILRTAGMERTQSEIHRDLDYLLRLWNTIREETLRSMAPKVIYEEANLIKRSIRDLYTSDIDEILVEGEGGYNVAKEFMQMLMPSHVKHIQLYKDDSIPLFFRYQVESQIDAIHSPTVQLKSGGYLVINQTEALVAIDVNSGRATRERHIEETALRTNLEAADEIARQIRLRDLAGLIVIDFIDMSSERSNHNVERRLRDAMRHDRARIQLGRISSFGLLELSRQRLRPSLVEINFEKCAHCHGTGHVRSVESAALFVLRAIEEEGSRHRASELHVSVPTKIALYILNQKRETLLSIEQRHKLRVLVQNDDTLIPPDHKIERVRTRPAEESAPALPVTADQVLASTPPEERAPDNGESLAQPVPESEQSERPSPRRGRFQKGRRGGRRNDEGHRTREAFGGSAPVAPEGFGNEQPAAEGAEPSSFTSPELPREGDDEFSQRRRGRRGGRRRRGDYEPRDRAPYAPRPSAGPMSEPPSIEALFEASEKAYEQGTPLPPISEPRYTPARPVPEQMDQPDTTPPEDNGPPRPSRKGWWNKIVGN